MKEEEEEEGSGGGAEEKAKEQAEKEQQKEKEIRTSRKNNSGLCAGRCMRRGGAKGAPFLRGTFDEDCTRRNARSKLVLSYLRTAGSHRKVNLSSR